MGPHLEAQVRYRVTVQGRSFDVIVVESQDGLVAALVSEGKEPAFERVSLSSRGGLTVLSRENASETLSLSGSPEEEGVYHVSQGGGRPLRCEVEDERRLLARAAGGASRAARTGPRVIRSIMPGIIVKVLAAPGASVAAKDPLLIVEAMKMQNEIRCEEAGVIAKVHVQPGQSVAAGAPLVELSPA
ncbi:biotin/lipoyl-binding protein [bacterium]|nr:biotin/lipoyl-binding protein [bacterium]